jgi:RND family efflux transporter MFP subunit
MERGMKLACILLIAAVAAGCSESEQQASPSAAAGAQGVPIAASAITTANSRVINPEFSLPALVEAVQSGKIRADVSANVAANHFTAGQLVKKGDLLVELDPAQYEAAVDAANAELLSARANLEQAEANWKRAESLVGQGYISDLDYDKAKASISVAQASVAKAQAGLDQATLNRDHTRIYAPFDGRISKPGYATGDFVAPSTGPLFELVQLDPIYVTANVAVSLYNDFVLLREELKEKGVDIPELKLYVQLAGERDYPYSGSFENWAHSSGDTSGMIAGRGLFPNPGGLLLPGQNVVLVGRAARAVTRIMIPQKAVMQDQQGRYIYTVDADDVVQRQNIEVGIRDGSDWAVVTGLDEGTRVIVEGLQSLRPGTRLAINRN